MRRCGLADAWAYRDVAAGRLHGASEERLARVLASAEMLVNLSGATLLRDEHLDIPVRVYLETDPVRIQVLIAQGDEDAIGYVASHTHCFSYGENLGAPDCDVPVERFEYHPTRPPVILDWWMRAGAGAPTLGARRFTTIANWKQGDRDVLWNGKLLTWSKHVQFEQFIDLASLAGAPIELALATSDSAAVARLRAAGWRIRPARTLSRDLDAYRDFIIGSAGEFTVAKEQNVRLRSGWFSDRTASYLAAGRPAIVQDTGFGCALPVGEGLFAFSDLEEARGAFETVLSDYGRHCVAARAVAEEHLRAETVIASMVETLAATATAA